MLSPAGIRDERRLPLLGLNRTPQSTCAARGGTMSGAVAGIMVPGPVFRSLLLYSISAEAEAEVLANERYVCPTFVDCRL